MKTAGQLIQVSDRVRIQPVELDEVSQLSGSRDAFKIGYRDARGDWRHWAQVLYLGMAKGIAERRAAELHGKERS